MIHKQRQKHTLTAASLSCSNLIKAWYTCFLVSPLICSNNQINDEEQSVLIQDPKRVNNSNLRNPFSNQQCNRSVNDAHVRMFICKLNRQRSTKPSLISVKHQYIVNAYATCYFTSRRAKSSSILESVMAIDYSYQPSYSIFLFCIQGTHLFIWTDFCNFF